MLIINKIFCFFGFHRWVILSSSTRMCKDCYKRQKRIFIDYSDEEFWVDYKD